MSPSTLTASVLTGALLALPPAANALPPAAWQRDLDALARAYVETHPAPFHRLSQADFRRAVAALAADLPRLDDAAVIVRLAELIAATGDGHSRLTLPLPENAGLFTGHAPTAAPRVARFHTLPIRLTAAGDGWLVTATAPELAALLGATVEAVDNQPIETVVERIAPIVHADNDAGRRATLPTFLVVPEVLHARGVARQPTDSRWRFRQIDGTIVERTLTPAASDGALAWARLEPRDADASPLTIQRGTDGLVYARIAEIADRPAQSFQAFTADVLRIVDATPAPRLVLDLRGNAGGDNSLFDALVRGVIARPALWRPGRLFVLTDAGTFSAAQNLVTALERWTPAIRVGAPTGAAPNGYGDARQIVLPASGLTLRVSTRYWQDAGPLDRREATAPHVPRPVTVDDLRHGRDPARAWIESLGARPHGATGEWLATVTLAGRDTPLRLRVAPHSVQVALPDLGLARAELSRRACGNADVHAAGRAGTRDVELHAAAHGRVLLGHLLLAGRPYPFVAERPVEGDGPAALDDRAPSVRAR
jgi:hypothetical protein